jgi:hypothetical protein
LYLPAFTSRAAGITGLHHQAWLMNSSYDITVTGILGLMVQTTFIHAQPSSISLSLLRMVCLDHVCSPGDKTQKPRMAVKVKRGSSLICGPRHNMSKSRGLQTTLVKVALHFRNFASADKGNVPTPSSSCPDRSQ